MGGDLLSLGPPEPIHNQGTLHHVHKQAIGFDMDYTLAQYRVETFEALAHEKTIDKLVRGGGMRRLGEGITDVSILYVKGSVLFTHSLHC